jgi:hypothetical protein
MAIGKTGDFKPTYRYASPEFLSGKKMKEQYLSSVSHDVWGYGHVLYEVATGLVPYFEENDDLDVAERIREGDAPGWPVGSSVPSWLCDLCKKCWIASPSERMKGFPQGMQTVVTDLCRLYPQWAKQVVVDLAAVQRSERRDAFS